jgi:hypothetical protein
MVDPCMLASSPASSLNQILARAGIPKKSQTWAIRL